MTPDQLAKSGSEHAHQRALFAYCAMACARGFEQADAWANGELQIKNCTEIWSSEWLDKPTPAPGPVPALEWIHAIHNQGHGDRIRGATAKAEGVRAGVADVFMPWPLWASNPIRSFGDVVYFKHMKYAGLYIEMKKPSEKPKKESSKGGLSDKQIEFRDYAKEVGFGWAVCYSWQEAVEVIKSYINWSN